MIPRSAVGIALVLAPLALWGGQRRFARVGEVEGRAEIQIHAAEPWQPAIRNTPLIESSRIRTSSGAHLEIELDEGSALRLAGDSLAEISDYAMLSTGQRITGILLDHGLAYFTGEPHSGDIVSLDLPGAQIILRQGSRIRLESSDQCSQISIIEGLVRLSLAGTEMDLREGQVARLDPSAPGRFSLYREIPQIESDQWSEERDKTTAHAASSKYVNGVGYGLTDLDRNGIWIQTSDNGPIWKPKVAVEWAPFQDGRWQWYDELGYTWIAGEPWGWLPYHSGRWLQDGGLGWVWVAGKSTVFKPGEVYWMRGANLAAWGPLAPGEVWTGAAPSRLFAGPNTSVAKFTAGVREFAPDAALPRPKDLLSAASFTVALPSPPLPASRLDAPRPALRVVTTRRLPVMSLVEPPAEISHAVPERKRETEIPPAPTENTVEPLQPQNVTQNVVAPEPVEVYYPVPVYEGIVIVNPPERRRERGADDRRHSPGVAPAPAPEVTHSVVARHPNEERRPQHVAAPAPPPDKKSTETPPSDKPANDTAVDRSQHRGR